MVMKCVEYILTLLEDMYSADYVVVVCTIKCRIYAMSIITILFNYGIVWICDDCGTCILNLTGTAFNPFLSRSPPTVMYYFCC